MVVEILETIGVGCFLAFAYFAVCRRKIEKNLERRRKAAIRIKWTPWAETILETKQGTRFEVSYRNADGTLHNAVCRTMLFSEVLWQDDD